MGEAHLHILLVEDNPADADLVQEALAQVDRQPAIAHVERLDQALQCLKLRRPVDCILLDLGLPDSNGLATLERVHSAAAHLPIIVLTGLEDEALGSEALRHGAQDYLVKGQTPPRHADAGGPSRDRAQAGGRGAAREPGAAGDFCGGDLRGDWGKRRGPDRGLQRAARADAGLLRGRIAGHGDCRFDCPRRPRAGDGQHPAAAGVGDRARHTPQGRHADRRRNARPARIGGRRGAARPSATSPSASGPKRRCARPRPPPRPPTWRRANSWPT